MLMGEFKVLLRSTLSATTVNRSGIEKLLARVDDKWNLPDCVEWLRLGLALRDIYYCPSWRAATLAVASLLAHHAFEKYLYSCVQAAENNERRRQRQKDRKAAFEELQQRLNSLEMSAEEVDTITSMDIEALVNSMKSGELKPVHVLHAFQIKAISAQNTTNCITEFVAEAEQWSSDLEAIPQAERGPLYGLPISVKENFALAGYDSTKGVVCYLGKIDKEDCAVITVLKSLGAIPFARTNMPQLGLSYDSDNPIYGTILHPLKSTHCPGGSSSGEAALIALRGSPLGIGDDCGGSIRCPAAWCGLSSLKPTYERISSEGRMDGTGQKIIPSISCPMTRNASDLAYLMQVLSGEQAMHKIHPFSPCLPFNDQVYQSKKPLKIGLFTYDQFCCAMPACERVVLEARKKLQSLGHQVVDWTPPNCHLGLWLCISVLSGDGGRKTLKEIRNDELASPLMYLYYVPSVFRRVLALALSPFSPMLSAMVQISTGVKSVHDWWNLENRIQEFRNSVIDSWKENELDAVICPAFGTPALPLNNNIALYAGNYLMLFNALNFPAGVVPAGHFNTQDLKNVESDYPQDTIFHRQMRQRVMQDSIGLPLSVQVASLPWQEETCLRIMKELQQK